MEIDFTKKMTEKSDEYLVEYVNNRMKYVPDAVEAAIAELQKRGHSFSDEELTTIKSDLEKKQSEINADIPTWNKNANNITNAPNAPLIYSQRAVSAFAILFSVLFGSIMLAINFKRLGKKKGIAPVIIFGVVYTSFVIYIVSTFVKQSSGTSGPSIILSAGGAAILKYLFWDKYIGKDTLYRAKPIWIPLLIGIAILVLFLTVTYIANTQQQQ